MGLDGGLEKREFQETMQRLTEARSFRDDLMEKIDRGIGHRDQTNSFRAALATVLASGGKAPAGGPGFHTGTQRT